MNRYFLTIENKSGGISKREATKEEFIEAEVNVGFNSKFSGEPATAFFQNGIHGGYIKYE